MITAFDRSRESSFFRKHANLILETTSGPVLDAPSGDGRHAFFLASRGREIICADNSESMISEIERQKTQLKIKNIKTALVDLNDRPWPFEKNSFGAAISTFFVAPDLVAEFHRVLTPNGLWLFQSYDNRGENYLELPAPGLYESLLLDLNFKIMLLDERPAGPRGKTATVRFIARSTEH